MEETGVLSSTKHSKIRPVAVSPIPIEAITPGFLLSDNFPAKGDNSAIITGWEIIISPAVLASKPFRY